MKKLLKSWYYVVPFLVVLLEFVIVRINTYLLDLPLLLWYFLSFIFWILVCLSCLTLFWKHLQKETHGLLATAVFILQLPIMLFSTAGVWLQLNTGWPREVGMLICEIKGDEYTYMFTNHHYGKCIVKAKDAGKVCTSTAQCEGTCIVLNNSKPNEGTCNEFPKPNKPYSYFEVLE